jgi:hypothetical protein
VPRDQTSMDDCMSVGKDAFCKSQVREGNRGGGFAGAGRRRCKLQPPDNRGGGR